VAGQREKFATQVSAKTLAAVRRLAEKEGRQIQALVDEALNDLVEKRRLAKARSRVIEAYQRSHVRYGNLYRKLAQ
jgi:mRNA-degrading endonuclease RelE of RelBE toxin-antitoxin system